MRQGLCNVAVFKMECLRENMVVFPLLLRVWTDEQTWESTRHCVVVCVWLCTGVYVSVYISVFDYGSGEATGPRWPRQPQASQVSVLSIPRWLLHSCENRKAAPTTNSRGTGGKTANLWLINNRGFLPLQDLFPILFFYSLELLA